MPRRTTTRKRGARTVYTDRRADVIIQAVLAGNHVTTACALAGIGTSTLYAWLERAQVVEDAINAGADYDRDWEPLLDFRDRLLVARAQAEEFAVDIIRQDMRGGMLVSEKPLVNEQGEAQYDDQGRLLADRTWSQPNGRLALTFLARSSPDKWGEKARVEVLTPEGEPVPDGDGEGVAPEVIAGALELAERLALTQRQRNDGYDIVDADVVEDAS